MDITVFRKRFRKLTTLEQDILKVLAVAYAPMSLEALTNIIRVSGITDRSGAIMLLPKIKEYCDLLKEGTWLIQNGENLQVAPKYMEWLMRMAVIDLKYRKIVHVIRHFGPYKELKAIKPKSLDSCIREMRILLYEGEISQFEELKAEAGSYFRETWLESAFWTSFFTPFDEGWIKTFPIEIQSAAISHLLIEACQRLEPNKELFEFANSLPLGGEYGKSLEQALFMAYFLGGHFQELNRFLSNQGNLTTSELQLLSIFRTAQSAEELSQYIPADFQIQNFGTLSSNFRAVLQLLVLLGSKSEGRNEQVIRLAARYPKHEFSKILNYLSAAACFQSNLLSRADELMSVAPTTALERLFYNLTSFWNESEWFSPDIDRLNQNYNHALQSGYKWVALQIAGLIASIESEYAKKMEMEKQFSQLSKQIGAIGLVYLVPRTTAWQRTLDALNRIESPDKVLESTDKKVSRLVWWLDMVNQKAIPVEQVYSSTGWSKGRIVSLTRLKESGLEAMTEQDNLATKAITYIDKNAELLFDFESLILALAGHPLLFLMENPAIAIELIEKKPQLFVEQTDEGFDLRFSHVFDKKGILIIRETPTRYQVLNVTEEFLEINRNLRFSKVTIPPEGKQKLLETIGRLSSMLIVQSDLNSESIEMPTIDGNAVPNVHMLPVGDGFKLEIFVKPFTTDPPYFKPGAGSENIISELEGQPTRALRNLTLERANVEKVLEACPSLDADAKDLDWSFKTADECLDVLLEMEPLRSTGELVMEYPKGEKLRVTGSVDFGSLSMGIRKNRDWFEVNGQLQVNENLVIDFRKLMDMAGKSNSRFIEINDGQFIALTNQLRKKLDELNHVLQLSRNQFRLHPLASHMFEDFAAQLQNLEVDLEWEKHLKSLQALDSYQPVVPVSFKAELRDYQKEGYNWLARLSHWGVGACLADDMGLGKTIQALAIILERASIGPAFVVAPASVVSNWIHEIGRFAPNLNPILLGEGDRKKAIKKLEPFDVMLCSYGLMQQESELLASVEFSTIVLDEAQAIKNRNTKRSKAAMALQGGFKMVTTGTPIENHLGELWNLFNFLTPGLLGPIDRFNENFAVPIERHEDRDAKAQLKRLLQPFILRRKKKEVLAELPEKTEVTLSVSLSEEERAFYEMIRRDAVEAIEQQAGNFAQRQFMILAALMKLRQACCHPKMVTPTSNLKSSKLELFKETVEDLLEEGHKALVFSQFVTHLRLVEEWVKKRGISYQYLDGSTPIPQRDKAIRAFQSGKSDLFLISLKAGGFGLNLTEADYVIHLDPWWNPAVEDQASDRSHRIGQKRPVTIYRLITENTIEQKIVKLHADKRELADSLLEGTDSGARLSSEELLWLIRS